MRAPGWLYAVPAAADAASNVFPLMIRRVFQHLAVELMTERKKRIPDQMNNALDADILRLVRPA